MSKPTGKYAAGFVDDLRCIRRDCPEKATGGGAYCDKHYNELMDRVIDTFFIPETPSPRNPAKKKPVGPPNRIIREGEQPKRIGEATPFWRRIDWVDKTPIATTFLLESANIQQLYRMWTEHSALGQSLTAWISVNLALALFLNYYRVKKLKWALYSTYFGVTLSTCVTLTVAYFRYLAR